MMRCAPKLLLPAVKPACTSVTSDCVESLLVESPLVCFELIMQDEAGAEAGAATDDEETCSSIERPHTGTEAAEAAEAAEAGGRLSPPPAMSPCIKNPILVAHASVHIEADR